MKIQNKFEDRTFTGGLFKLTNKTTNGIKHTKEFLNENLSPIGGKWREWGVRGVFYMDSSNVYIATTQRKKNFMRRVLSTNNILFEFTDKALPRSRSELYKMVENESR